eukprot:PhF_6_TR40577/c0_g1_i1/m.60849/K20405/NPRL2; nitrogen permease regulator 2-like protein
MHQHWLQGVLYCEFDNHKGQQISHQAPPKAFTESNFNDIANFVIPKAELNARITILRASSGLSIMYLCREIRNELYPRHKFTFSIAFVFKPSTPRDIIMSYREPLRKIVHELRCLEQDGMVLFRLSSQFNDVIPDNIPLLPSLTSGHFSGLNIQDVIQTLYESLRAPPFECVVTLHPSHVVIVNAVVPMAVPDTSHVTPWSVPVRKFALPKPEDTDALVYDVCRMVDGKSHCYALAHRLHADVDWVIRAVKHLVAHQYADIIDIFQYSNLYATTEKFGVFSAMSDKDVMHSFVTSVVEPSQQNVTTQQLSSRRSLRSLTGESMDVAPIAGYWDHTTVAATPEEQFSCCMWVLSRFSSVGPFESVSEVLSRQQPQHSCWRSVASTISAPKLIRTAVLYGIIRRVHEYPELKSNQHDAFSHVVFRDHVEGGIEVRVQEYLDGSKSMDELCVRWLKSRSQLVAELKDRVIYCKR